MVSKEQAAVCETLAPVNSYHQLSGLQRQLQMIHGRC